MTKKHIIALFFTFPFFLSFAQGTLVIIGGGKRPPVLIDRLVSESKVNQSGYIVILPMASEEQDSSIFYAKKQFVKAGINNISGIMMKKGELLTASQIDSIGNASLLYIAGGSQAKFMEIVGGTEVEKAIKKCYQKGNVVAGTSAGAAVMSEKMITGVELKYKETTEDNERNGFQTIEEKNIEITQGLGFLKQAIIDQHFIKRKRQNRLIAVAIENPGMACVGIDEATAIVVKNGIAEVVGDSQVLTLFNSNKKSKTVNGHLGATGMKLDLYVAGDKFKIR